MELEEISKLPLEEAEVEEEVEVSEQASEEISGEVLGWKDVSSVKYLHMALMAM